MCVTFRLGNQVLQEDSVYRHLLVLGLLFAIKEIEDVANIEPSRSRDLDCAFGDHAIKVAHCLEVFGDNEKCKQYGDCNQDLEYEVDQI